MHASPHAWRTEEARPGPIIQTSLSDKAAMARTLALKASGRAHANGRSICALGPHSAHQYPVTRLATCTDCNRESRAGECAQRCGAPACNAQATRCILPTSSTLNLRVHSPRAGYFFFFLRSRPSPNRACAYEASHRLPWSGAKVCGGASIHVAGRTSIMMPQVVGKEVRKEGALFLEGTVQQRLHLTPGVPISRLVHSLSCSH
jgi:hypothetical protein